MRNITTLAQLQPRREIRHLALKLSNAYVPAPQLLLPTLCEPRLQLCLLLPQLPYNRLQLLHTDLTAFEFFLVTSGALCPHSLVLDLNLQLRRELLELLHAPLELLRLVAPLLHILLQSLDDEAFAAALLVAHHLEVHLVGLELLDRHLQFTHPPTLVVLRLEDGEAMLSLLYSNSALLKYIKFIYFIPLPLHLGEHLLQLLNTNFV